MKCAAGAALAGLCPNGRLVPAVERIDTATPLGVT
jgi:hypothetical protein